MIGFVFLVLAAVAFAVLMLREETSARPEQTRLTDCESKSVHPIERFSPYSRQEAQMIAPQRLKQVQESVKLVNSTKAPNVFFERFDFMIECLNDLAKCEKTIKFSGEAPSAVLHKFSLEKEQSINDFLNRYAASINEKIASLKTDAAKKRAVVTFENALDEYKHLFYPSNHALYDRKKTELWELIPEKVTQTIQYSEIPPSVELALTKTENEKGESPTLRQEVQSQTLEPIHCQSPDRLKRNGSKWEISVSFGDTTSKSLESAIFLAKQAPRFEQSEYNGKTIYQAFYGSDPKEYLAFVRLYEFTSKWKKTVAMINGELVDRKIIGGLNYCYGDYCRNGRTRFCYGASEFTENPFGCHRLQISASNHPWYTFSRKTGSVYTVNKNAIRQRIDEFATAYRLCPKFNYDKIIRELETLPDHITESQMQQLNPFGAYALQEDNEIQAPGMSL